MDLLVVLLIGVFLGRVAACLYLFIPESGVLKPDFWSFFLKTQEKHSWISLPGSLANEKRVSLVIEVLMPLLFLCLWWHTEGGLFNFMEYALLIFGLVVVSAVDIRYMVLPDAFTLSGILIGLLGAFLNPDRSFLPALSGVLLGGGFLWLTALVYYAVRKEEGMGGGDIKLMAWLGAVLTWRAIPFVILCSCFTGLLAAMGCSLFHRKINRRQALPFGPFLSLSAVIYLFFGQWLGERYLEFFLPNF